MNYKDLLFLRGLDERKLYGYMPYAERFEKPVEQVKKLKERGYVEFSSPEDNLNRLTIPELNQLLKDNGIKATGTKPILINAVVNNLSTENYRSLTEKGIKLRLTQEAWKLVDAYDYVFWFEENKPMYFRINWSDVERLAETTPTSEMIAAIQDLDRKHRINEHSYTSQLNSDMYNEIRYGYCVHCNSKSVGPYDICQNCENQPLTETEVFHLQQLFNYKNKGQLRFLTDNMVQAERDGSLFESTSAFKDFCYSEGVAGVLFYEKLKGRSMRLDATGLYELIRIHEMEVLKRM